MNFWQKVEDICKYKCISRKELATAASFSVNTISNGIKRNGMPEADLALRISKVLDVPLEELLVADTVQNKKINKYKNEFESRQELLKNYMPLIQKLEQIPKATRQAIVTIIENAT